MRKQSSKHDHPRKQTEPSADGDAAPRLTNEPIRGPEEPLLVLGGRKQDKDEDLAEHREPRDGGVLTTDQGLAVVHTDDSLKAGPRGPTLLEDFHLREKITRFDHERIPERVVHARGSGAHGFFRVYESLADLTCADFLCDPAARTPVFTRFSTVAGSRGSTDLARDVRGFATKFYTRQGNFDLVGNNMPVFFIQDGAKFPDLIHAVKPEPHNEVPQAASAHDTFWDFVSLMPETMHMVMWLMSDRAIPRSYRMMEGFGVHTFRLVNAEGRSTLCKFHWKPVLGAHSVVWDEAQKISGKDPDFHRRDLWEAIACGQPAEYELGLQLLGEDELAYGIDLLDATKLVPEELVPVRRVGRLTLDRNPDNFFAETEQVAFCVGNLVPGIDFTNDPLLQARLFSYLDTQITRLGGPNFTELPINRPLAFVRNHQQDGMHRRTIHTARALYHPNSIANGAPPPAAQAPSAFQHLPQHVAGPKTRRRSETFDDHFSQARLFLHSQSPAERSHLIDACRFELGKVQRFAIRRRVIALFREIDEDLAREVARSVGVRLDGAPTGRPAARRSAPEENGLRASPALSLEQAPRTSIATRRVAVLGAPGASGAEVAGVVEAVRGGAAEVEFVSHHLGAISLDDGTRADATQTFLTTSSVLYDAVVVPGGRPSVDALLGSTEAPAFVQEASDHFKPIAAGGEGLELLLAAGILGDEQAADLSEAPRTAFGIVTAPSGHGPELGRLLVEALLQHRHFDRPPRQPLVQSPVSPVSSRIEIEQGSRTP